MFYPNAKLVILVSCIAALIPQRPSDALLLGNFIGCNSFGCRLSALESEVAQLKQQVARMSDPTGMQGMQGMNNFRPNQMLPYGQNQLNNMNQQQQGQQQGAANQQGTTNQQGGGTSNTQAPNSVVRANYALDYPVANQNLRRVQGYQNQMNNDQFTGN